MINLKKFLALTIYVEDYNSIADRPEVLKKLRALTISRYSGMNHELNNYESIKSFRKVNCKILTAYNMNKLVGWALLTKEESNFGFGRSYNGFKANDGAMFQVYVDYAHRKQGIANELLKIAMRREPKLYVCPHDDSSHALFKKINTPCAFL